MGTYIPPQYNQPALHDYRCAVTGPRGYTLKRKREEEESNTALVDQMELDVTDNSGLSAHASKRAKNNAVGIGKSSGRPWKEPGERAGTLRNANLSTTWAQKMQLKDQHLKFREAKLAVIQARKEKMQAIRRRKEAAKAMKQSNREKSVVTQTISKVSTVKRMLKSRKGRKQLRKADTTVVEPCHVL